jgi:hypothetical protein
MLFDSTAGFTAPVSRVTTGAVALTLAGASVAHAQVAWTDWTSSGPNTALGTLVSGSSTVGVSFTGPYTFVQTTCGTNYWTNPTTYSVTGPADAPPPCDIIALDAGGLKTITFSQAVTNPLLAIASWNGQPTTFFNAGPLQIVAQGPGYWGTGTISVSGNTMSTSGEAHGTIRILGTYNSISFTDGPENWHGITVGVESVATVTPEPSTYVLMASGLIGVFGFARRRRSA